MGCSMAKWLSTIPEVLHEIGRDSPLGKALVSLVETGTAEYPPTPTSVDAELVEKLARNLEQLEAMTLVPITGGLEHFADSSTISYLEACHEKARYCNGLAAKLLSQ